VLSDTSSTDSDVEVAAGDVPNALVGTYTGTLSGTAEADDLPLERDFTEPVTITVSENNTITFSGDDPEETFTTQIGSNGGFNGSLDIVEDECDGVLNVFL